MWTNNINKEKSFVFESRLVTIGWKSKEKTVLHSTSNEELVRYKKSKTIKFFTWIKAILKSIFQSAIKHLGAIIIKS